MAVRPLSGAGAICKARKARPIHLRFFCVGRTPKEFNTTAQQIELPYDP